MMPIGGLMKKIQCQLIGVGQHAAGQQADRPARGGHEPVDAERLRLLARLGNIVTIMPRITAEVSAPPTPWMKRAAISISCV